VFHPKFETIMIAMYHLVEKRVVRV